MTATALSNAFARSGVLPRDVHLKLAIAQFQNNGGEYGVARDMLDAAYEREVEGRRGRVVKDRTSVADASPTNDGEAGLRAIADEATDMMPASPSNERAGQRSIADQVKVAVPAASRRLPGHAKRGAVAIASVQGVLAQSLFDTMKLPDGRKLKDVRWGECPELSRRYGRASRLLMAIHNHAVPPDPNTTLDSIVSDGELRSIVAKVGQLNDTQ